MNTRFRLFRSVSPVLALVAGLLLLVGCQNAARDMKKTFSGLFPPSPGEAARMMFSFDPDTRRQGVTWLAASKFGGEDVYVRSYRMLIDDPDATVRAAAAKALGAHGKVEDALLLVRRLKDPMPYVRWEAAA